MNDGKRRGRGSAGVTHSAHDRGQVLPAQLEERQGVAARHVPDVGAEAIGSCGREQTAFRLFVTFKQEVTHPGCLTGVTSTRVSADIFRGALRNFLQPDLG